MTPISFQAFQADAMARGFDEVLERKWPPNTVLAAHAHSFAADALVVQGEMWLTVGGQVRHLLPGDVFTLDGHVVHEERYGAGGAVYWVARRNSPAIAAS